MKTKPITKKSLQSLPDIIGDGKKLTEKDKKEISEALAKFRAQRNRKRAA